MKKIKKAAQSIIEYGLILALIAIIAVAVLSKFGASINKPDGSSHSNLTPVQEKIIKDYCKSVGKIFDKNKGQCSDKVKL